MDAAKKGDMFDANRVSFWEEEGAGLCWCQGMVHSNILARDRDIIKSQNCFINTNWFPRLWALSATYFILGCGSLEDPDTDGKILKQYLLASWESLEDF